MSDIVANNVTSQLLDFMKSMMNEHKNTNTENKESVQTEKSQTNTSDNIEKTSTYQGQKTIVHNISQRLTTHDMLNALPTITPRTLRTSSNHDKSHKLSTSHK